MPLRRAARPHGSHESSRPVVKTSFGDLQIHRACVDDELARMLEIDGDAIADSGLDLAHSPLRLIRMADENAGNEIDAVRHRGFLLFLDTCLF